MLPTPAQRLRQVLAPLTRRELSALAKRAGVGADATNRARAGQQVNANRYVRLCAAAGISVMTGKPAPVRSLGNIEWRFFALGVEVHCRLRKISLRKAAKAIGVSPATLSRLENGKEVAIGSVIKICRWMGPATTPEHYAPERPMFHVERKSETAGKAA